METTFLIKFFGALFAIMNPFIGLPVFLSMTEDGGSAFQRKIALKVGVYVLIIGVIVSLAGTQVLKFFGISIHDLQVAGGLVVFGLALSMLGGKESSMHHGTEKEQGSYPKDASIAFYPLAFPLMMGPGTLTTLILFAGQVDGMESWVGFYGVFLVAVLLVVVVFALGSRLGAHLSNHARVIMSRVMGLILAAIAVEMVIEGIKVLLPGLAG